MAREEARERAAVVAAGHEAKQERVEKEEGELLRARGDAIDPRGNMQRAGGTAIVAVRVSIGGVEAGRPVVTSARALGIYRGSWKPLSAGIDNTGGGVTDTAGSRVLVRAGRVSSWMGTAVFGVASLLWLCVEKFVLRWNGGYRCPRHPVARELARGNSRVGLTSV